MNFSADEHGIESKRPMAKYIYYALSDILSDILSDFCFLL